MVFQLFLLSVLLSNAASYDWWIFRCLSIFRRHAKKSLALPTSSSTEDDLTDAEFQKASVWLPACIAEAEKLAAYCKSMATKANNVWLRTAENGANGLGSSNEDADSEKLTVIKCCRNLRKAVATAQSNMNLLEKKIVHNYQRSYGTTAEIDLTDADNDNDSVSCASSSHTTTAGGDPLPKRLVLKIKNFREASKKEDYYAEIRGSPLALRDKAGGSSKVPPARPETEEKHVHSNETDAANRSQSQLESTTDDNYENDELDASKVSAALPSAVQVSQMKKEPSLVSLSQTPAVNGSKVASATRAIKEEPEPASPAFSVLASSTADSETLCSSTLTGSAKRDAKARAQLLKSSSEAESDENFELDAPLNKAQKNKKVKKMRPKKDEAVNVATDPKLNSECAVVVMRILDSVTFLFI